MTLRAYLCFKKQDIRGLVQDAPHPIPLFKTTLDAPVRYGDVFYGTVRDVFGHFCFVQLTPDLLGFMSLQASGRPVHSGEKIWVQVDRLPLDGNHEHKMPRVRREIKLQSPYFFYEFPEDRAQNYPTLRFSKNLVTADQKRLRQWVGTDARLATLGGALLLRGRARDATPETWTRAITSLGEDVARLRTSTPAQGHILFGPDPMAVFLDTALHAGCLDFFISAETSAPWGEKILKDYAAKWAPGMETALRIHKEPTSFFEDLWAEKTTALSHFQGQDGSLIIEKTAALTSIDVNGHPDYVPAFNLMAAHDIVRRIVELNLSGVILIDFIDLASQSAQNKKALLGVLEAALREDPERGHVLGLTPSGLVEISRRCTGPSFLEN